MAEAARARNEALDTRVYAHATAWILGADRWPEARWADRKPSSASRRRDVLHVYRPIDAGQIRGLPHIAPAMVRLFLLDQYDDAELDRKKTAAMFAGFITKTVPEEPMMGEAGLSSSRPSALRSPPPRLRPRPEPRKLSPKQRP